MDNDQLALLRKTIQDGIAQTDERIIEYEELTNPIAPENAIGRVSRMDAINNKSIYEEALRKAEKKKRALESALARLDEEGFEKCIQCGQDIQFERLKLMPESRLCISCARRR